MLEIVLWLVVVALFLIGLAGVLIPFLPGIGLIYAGILIYGLATDFAAISKTTVVLLGVVAFLTWLAQYYAGSITAKMGGGKRYSVLGALGGAMIGVFLFPPVGLVVGAFAGAVLGALYEGRDTEAALRIGITATIGVLGAVMLQVLIGISMIIAFFLALLL